jgi:hypothetical protein
MIVKDKNMQLEKDIEHNRYHKQRLENNQTDLHKEIDRLTKEIKTLSLVSGNEDIKMALSEDVLLKYK